jgi:glycosyltransferase involved in cell wall biosynthesis
MERIPQISVIVPTRNRASRLPPFFEALCRIQSVLAYEIIVVNNGSTDDTGLIAKGYFDRLGDRFILIDEPRRGVAYAKNAGLKLARGEIVAFFDDDCYPAPDFIDAVWLSFRRPEVGFIGGRVELFDPADVSLTVLTDKQSRHFPPKQLIMTGELLGANMAFRVEVIRRIGEFDVLFGPGAAVASCEDNDYIQRASNAGYFGTYDPNVVVYHHHRRRAEHVARLTKNYSIGRGAFLAKMLFTNPSLIAKHMANRRRESGSLIAYAKVVCWDIRREGIINRIIWVPFGFCKYLIVASLQEVIFKPSRKFWSQSGQRF